MSDLTQEEKTVNSVKKEESLETREKEEIRRLTPPENIKVERGF